jgi:hypothetical protein
MPLLGQIAMSGRRTTSRLDADASAPPTAVERVVGACPASVGAGPGATAPSFEAFAPWLSLVDALAEDAARRMWEQASPATSPAEPPTRQAASRRKGRGS